MQATLASDGRDAEVATAPARMREPATRSAIRRSPRAVGCSPSSARGKCQWLRSGCPASRRVSWNDPATRGDFRSHWALSHWAPGDDLPADRKLRAGGFTRIHSGSAWLRRWHHPAALRRPGLLSPQTTRPPAPAYGAAPPLMPWPGLPRRAQRPPEPGYAGTPAPQTSAPTGLSAPARRLTRGSFRQARTPGAGEPA